ncbi:MAG TPA: cobalamin-binding protein [Vicinamibacterales bacterium]|nr:cobalamin-binding protein [Vicinamibacterales bacterium]
MLSSPFPTRIVCLTEETTETLYLLGEGDRVVGISGYTVRPSEARQKPKVSSFLHARYDKIAALAPDLILAFSDLQADITTELVKRGYPVFTFNQRSVSEILQMIRVVGGIVGVPDTAAALVAGFERGLADIRASAARFPTRPRVYFEEWDDPLISGIRWVEELVEIAGGTPVFPELRAAGLGKDRIITADRVIAAAPDVFIGSWCGKPVKKDKVRRRAGWHAVPFIVADRIYEVKSTYVLQPGPAALTEGARQLHAVLCRAVGLDVPASLRPAERWDDGC